MGRQKKRTRTTAKKSAASKITIREVLREKDGRTWVTHLVQGWQEDGKWKRKQFSNAADAERFAALKRVEMENEGKNLRMVLSPLSDDQLKQAETAIERLGETYSLAEAVDYFLTNHRPPEYTLTLRDAIRVYLDERERDGIRPRTITNLKSTLGSFEKEMDGAEVHTITAELVESYLRGLRAKDGITPASRKTWNNVRNELNHFFKFASTGDLATNRPWIFHNPIEKVRHFTAKQVAEQRGEVITSDVQKAQRVLSVLMRWRGGALVKPFALAYFAGIRPDMNGELGKLAEREAELINLRTNVMTIPAGVSKTKEARKVTISPNLRQWLLAYKEAPIKPTNWDRLSKQARKHFGFAHDETRHSFISYHVALHRSVGDAALQAGNSEGIVKKHYLNLFPREDGEAFFSLVPDRERRRAIIAPTSPPIGERPHLKAV